MNESDNTHPQEGVPRPPDDEPANEDETKGIVDGAPAAREDQVQPSSEAETVPPSEMESADVYPPPFGSGWPDVIGQSDDKDPTPNGKTEAANSDASADPPIESQVTVEDESSQEPEHESGIPRDHHAYPPLAGVPAIGDPGRQAEVVPVLGDLTVGVADTELDFVTADPFEVRACSTRGHSHRYMGTPRQDAFALASSDDWLVVAVADGVSEGAHSHVAAATAVRVACKLVLDRAEERGGLDWTEIAGRISRRIVDEATLRRIVDPGEDDESTVRSVRSAMATTAVVAVISKHSNGANTFPGTLAVLAGDSGAYTIRDGAVEILIGGKQIDEGSPITRTAVHPLPGPATPEVIDFALGQDAPLILTSDGLGDPIGSGEGEVGLEIASRWSDPPTAVEFLADMNFLRRTFDDDRTAVGVWVLPEAIQLEADEPPEPI